jgi:hypothetical protein
MRSEQDGLKQGVYFFDARRQPPIFAHSLVVRACSRQKLTRAVLAVVFGMLAAHACARVLTLSSKTSLNQRTRPSACSDFTEV